MSDLSERKAKLLITIQSAFSFLVDDYQFLESLETEQDENSGGPKYYFLRYTNQKLKRQLEILLHRNSDYHLVTLKQLVNHSIPSYYDLNNTISVKDLDLIHSPEKFNYQSHIVYSDENRISYFANIAKQFRNDWLAYITGEQWFDRKKVNELYRMKNFIGLSGFRKDKTISAIAHHITFLKEYQYEVILNSNDEDPFKYTSQGKIVLYNKEKDIYLKFNISYKDKILSFEKKHTQHQSYRLLKFIQFDPYNIDNHVEELVNNWVNSELEKGGI